MSKYIDADRLKVVIKQAIRREELNFAALGSGGQTFCINTLEWVLTKIDSLQQETSEISLEKFTEKMDDWKARYNHPDNISIKATMAFTARMFYMYPDIAREWYGSLPKVTQD